METSLVNFNIPTTLKHSFDAICRMSKRTRTSVLIEIIASHVIDQSDFYEDRQRRLYLAGRTIETIHGLNERVSNPVPTQVGARIGVHTPSEFDFDDDEVAAAEAFRDMMQWE